MNYLTYIFWPNPGNATYESPTMMAGLLIAAFLIVLSFIIRAWRKRQTNSRAKTLSKSWASACIWFGVIAGVLVVSRVEQISFLSMRFLWVIWAAIFIVYGFIQWRAWRTKYYEVVEQERVEDPRDKYLPRKKK